MTDQTSQAAIRRRLGSLPVVGYVLRWGWLLLRLPKKFDFLRVRQEEMRFQVAELTELCRRNGLLADDHDLDNFYMDFENNFRGTEAEIKDRLRVYVPRLRKLGIDFAKHPVLDIGCGRGEMIDLLQDESIKAVGLDLNADMVRRCKERGLQAVQADAFEYLRAQKENSLGAITGFHIVEHIPFGSLIKLFQECLRVLVPGGVVIFETPNPENTDVGSFTFYYDPSHLHPLAPEVLAFALRNRGFATVDIIRLHPKGDGHEADHITDPQTAAVVRRFYMERDFAVIGHKHKAAQ